MFKLLKFVWKWFTGQSIKQEQIVPKVVLPRAPVKKGSLQDIVGFCDEVRKDLWIRKKTDDRLYVEMGNLKDKIERFIDNQK